MSMFTLAISCLIMSSLPWFMDLTFQVPMQYCFLQHWTLLTSPVTYWVPTDLGSSSFSVLSFCLFILFIGFSRQEYWNGLPLLSPEQYCIGTRNVRSMNQGKLEVVKQEMTRVNIGILGISELKWTGMGEFNSDDHYIYYYGQESLRRNGVDLIVNKSLKWSTWVQSQKWQDVRLQGKQFNITVIQVYALTNNAEEAEVEWFYEDLQDLLEHQKKILFIIGDWNTKVRSQEIPGVAGKFGLGSTKWSRAKAKRVLPRELTDHSKHPLPTT